MKTSGKLYLPFIFVCFALFLQNNVIRAQDDEEVTWRDRLYFGGNISLSVGTITAIQLSPLAGYRITPRWSAGLGLDYEYYKSSGTYYGTVMAGPYSTSIYGGNIFTNFVFLKNFPTKGISLMAETEYEALNLESKYFQDYYSSGRFWLHSFLAGGGIRQRLGRRSSFNLLILWNFNETQYSPYYSNPILKFNFIF
jgi:hypothetical protein